MHDKGILMATLYLSNFIIENATLSSTVILHYIFMNWRHQYIYLFEYKREHFCEKVNRNLCFKTDH